MKNLYSILLNFSDHVVGIDQIEALTAIEALQEFINTSESLKQYDRSSLQKSVGILQIKGNGRASRFHGLWSFWFKPENMASGKWPNDNPPLGGHIIQTDSNGPIRE